MNSGLDFTGGWNSLIEFAPNGMWNLLAAIGVAIIVASLIMWMWKRRKGGGGGGGGGVPWMSIAIGAVLAGPKVFIPILLLIAQAAVMLIAKVIEWGGQRLL